MTDGGLTIYSANATRGRSCGSCTLCCTLMPVELQPGRVKPAGTRCPMVRAKGCGVYARRPRPCREWSCRWLFDETTANIKRPDLSGIVIDSTLDTILLDGQPYEVLQVWIDPKRRDAHRDPALRDWLVFMHAKHGLLAVIRYNSSDGFLLFPPASNSTDEWQEMAGNIHSRDSMAQVMKDAGAVAAPYSLQAIYGP